MSQHQINQYTCKNGHVTTTLDIHEGTTPFLTSCPDCGIAAASAFYRCDQSLDADLIWYRPTRVSEVNREHVEMGGLITMPTRLPLHPIEFQLQPHRASCLVTSFAMVLGVSVAELIEQIGHDGTEVVLPQLKEPYCFRGHHIQELVRACHQRGYSVTLIEPIPVSQHQGHQIHHPAPMEWIDSILQARHGVLVGQLNGRDHSLAWDGHLTYNPANGLAQSIYAFSLRLFAAITPYPELCKIKSIRESVEIPQI